MRSQEIKRRRVANNTMQGIKTDSVDHVMINLGEVGQTTMDVKSKTARTTYRVKPDRDVSASDKTKQRKFEDDFKQNQLKVPSPFTADLLNQLKNKKDGGAVKTARQV